MSHLRTIDLGTTTIRRPARPLPSVGAPVKLTLEGRVQNALNLVMPLKSPAQMPALGRLLAASQPEVEAALTSLRYVHFARFVSSPDYSQLMTITTYDGGLDAYTMDFVAVLGNVFTAVLRFIRGAPPLPVQKYPREFLAFVRKHNVPTGLWSAYPELTVLEIRRAAGR